MSFLGPRRAIGARLAAELLGPALPGAACRGRAPRWDLELAGEAPHAQARRHEEAIAACRTCPARLACAATVGDLPREAAGIWAGRLLVGRGDAP